jgi:hypothetical protein
VITTVEKYERERLKDESVGYRTVCRVSLFILRWTAGIRLCGLHATVDHFNEKTSGFLFRERGGLTSP